jgi:anti-anti-sigma regulatory factor
MVRLDSAYSVASAAEFKTFLLEGLASRKKLQLDLSQTEQIDITLLQLLWAGARAAAGENREFVICMTESAALVARNAGFESFPGGTIEISPASAFGPSAATAQTSPAEQSSEALEAVRG